MASLMIFLFLFLGFDGSSLEIFNNNFLPSSRLYAAFACKASSVHSPHAIVTPGFRREFYTKDSVP
jgi:hypothetical protein